MIKMVNVSKYYYSAKGASLGLRNINLELPDVGFVAITGESGSGKSTMLNVISGVDSYEEGEMYFNGIDTSIFDAKDYEEYRKTNVAIVYQNYNLIESYNALDNVISSMLINGYSYDEAVEVAKKILEDVGLKEHIYSKSTYLSTGQRQRLAIARALAKNTPIIVCDEPTGNLDSDTGKQIIKLLHEISKTKLVIVATHNYPDFAPYVDVFVRLYRGEMNSYEEINKVECEKKSEDRAKNKNSYLKFVNFNFKSQPNRIFLNIIFVMICSLVIFVTLAFFTSNIDKSKTLIVSSAVFPNCTKERIVVKDEDGFTEDEINEILSIKKVNSVERYDLANEVNYYYEKGKDFEYTYDIIAGVEVSGNPGLVGMSHPKFLDNSHFLRSAASISEADLSEGRLPEKTYEIVLYNSNYHVGDKVQFFFQNTRIFGNGSYYPLEMTVVGILANKKDKQVYFSNKLMESFVYQSKFANTISALGNLPGRDYAYKRNINVRFICDDNLEERSVRVNASNYYTIYSQFATIYDLYIVQTRDVEIQNIENVYSHANHEFSSYIAEVSRDLFDLYVESVSSNQISIYISDYAYVDKVIKELDKLGYDSVSPYKSGSATYDEQLVKERLISLYLSFAVLVVVSILQIALVYVLSKLKKADYIILKSLGLTNAEAYKVNQIEMVIIQVISYACAILFFYLLVALKISYVLSVAKYIRFYHFIISFVYVIVLSFITSLYYRKYLSKKVKILSLMED